MTEMKMQEISKKNIEKIVGVPIKKISKMGACNFDILIEKKIGKKLQVTTQSNPHLEGRGSVFIAMKRLVQTELIDKKLEMIAS